MTFLSWLLSRLATWWYRRRYLAADRVMSESWVLAQRRVR